MRATIQVLEDHLERRERGDIEGDLEHNYAEDVVLICEHGVLHGRDAVRNSAKALADQLPGARFRFPFKAVDGEHALLHWSAQISTCARRFRRRYIRHPRRSHRHTNSFVQTRKLHRLKSRLPRVMHRWQDALYENAHIFYHNDLRRPDRDAFLCANFWHVTGCRHRSGRRCDCTKR